MAAHTPTTMLELRAEDLETHASKNAKMVGAFTFKISQISPGMIFMKSSQEKFESASLFLFKRYGSEHRALISPYTDLTQTDYDISPNTLIF